IGAIGVKVSAEGASRPAPAAVAHVVQPGETLWAIARAHGPAGSDPRRFVYHLEKMNDLSGPLLAGQVLRLPAG
ncbi:MAG: LysM peptidoglycan-binding domain-containing protein, partial [Actinomycetota bacterium]